MSKIYPKHPFVARIRELVHTLYQEKYIHIQLLWTPSHVGNPGNETADQKAKEATTEQLPDDEIKTIDTDIRNSFKKWITENWENEWPSKRDNKLRMIKNSTKPWETYGTRKQQIMITRLRIGHTRLTQQHLFDISATGKCETCNTPLTVDHIITECRKFENARQKYNIPENLCEALDNNRQTIDKLLHYLKESKLDEQI